MKNIHLIFTLLLFVTISCQDQGKSNPPSSPKANIPGRTLYEPGMVEIKFTKNVLKPDAEKFIQGFNLVLKDFADQNDSTHLGLVEVPIGQEQIWVDSLKTYTSIVAGASLVPIVYVD